MSRDQIAAIEAVAVFIGGAKDRLGRPDPAANDAMREARQTIQRLAIFYGVGGGHATYLDQCAALLRAVAAGVSGPDAQTFREHTPTERKP